MVPVTFSFLRLDVYKVAHSYKAAAMENLYGGKSVFFKRQFYFSY